MRISYKKIAKHPRIFLRLFGIKVEEFERILFQLEKLWEKKVKNSYKRPGRYYKLPLSDMLMMLLLYYKTYSTQMQIGFMFSIDDSRVCRIIKRLEPLVARIVAIEKNRDLSQEEAALLIDVTEQGIERPKKRQREFYSGKKKRHTFKTEIRVTVNGKIRNVSKSYGGKTHDFKIHKQSDHLPIDTKVYGDSGYQGLSKICKFGKTPIKKKRKVGLNKRQKLYNKILSKKRVKVENVFCQIKNFRILSERYRNKGKKHNLKFNIIAGIVNMKNGFLNKNLAA
jgi:DNA-binding MarR family transcriptional regulator/transposase